ncbi:uncharacterized protein [Chaetodon trifascialis]|uniref:uncharacterized protein n=1 Tax=Chaetodon trifascialis TaxID=109706 RepID=UPI0039952078
MDDTGQGRWCQTEGQTTVTVLTNDTSISLRESGCCWVSNVNGKTNWTTYAELNVGTRSDTHVLNNCPVTTTVSSLRVPQNCFSEYHLLAHDPDGDHVRCYVVSQANVSSNVTLNETTCTLMSTGEVDVGLHVFEIEVEDFPAESINLTYKDGASEVWEPSDMSPPLCKLSLQFTLEVLAEIPDCEAGHVLPKFLSSTPSHGSVLSATVGQTFHLMAEAQAHHASINDFQISGPLNMSKEFTDEAHGKAKIALSWTPEDSDVHRVVPVCFTAETNESQSDMRCVVVTVSEASVLQGKVSVHCLSKKMVVAIEKASIPDIDENFLRLKDDSCTLTSNSTHIIGKTPFSGCGTHLEDKGGFITFKNVIRSIVLPTEIISRRRTVKIDFSCQFPKAMSISSSFKLEDSDYVFTESSFGSFGYSFNIYSNNSFTNKVDPSAYPVEVKMLDMVYMGIKAESELPNVKLFVESCKATPDDDPDNSIFYDLIKNGCLQDETVTVYSSDETTFNFEVQAFKFSGDYNQVYITCSVILCEPESPFSRCAQGCQVDAARRRRRSFSRETESHQIIQGPLQFAWQDGHSAAVENNNFNAAVENHDTPAEVVPPPVSSDTRSSREDWKDKEDFSTNVSSGGTNISTIFFACSFLASLVSLAAVVGHFTRKRKAEDCKALIGSDQKN